MAKRKPRKPYKGIFATSSPKIIYRRTREENWLQYREIVVPKMDALFDHYKVDRNHPRKWEHLAFWLAWEHVPGFAPPLKQGRKAGNISRDYHLYWAIARATFNKKTSVNNAIRQLTIKDPRFKGKSPGTLRDRYYLLKDGRSKEFSRLLAFMEWMAEERYERRDEERREERREEERREEERREEERREEEMLEEDRRLFPEAYGK
jgi:hypothetical protein